MLGKTGVQEVLFVGVSGFERSLSSAKCERAMFFTDVACEHLLTNEDSYLPVKSESQECVVLLHGLDVAVNPHAVLREMSRIVSRDGYLIIIGFNQLSVWGSFRPFGRLIKRRSQQVPWQLNFYRIARLADWLKLLGFETGKVRTLGYRPLVQNRKLSRFMGFMDTCGKLLLPGFGNVYISLARKRTIPLTPEPMLARLRAALIKAGLPKTSTEGV